MPSEFAASLADYCWIVKPFYFRLDATRSAPLQSYDVSGSARPAVQTFPHNIPHSAEADCAHLVRQSSRSQSRECGPSFELLRNDGKSTRTSCLWSDRQSAGKLHARTAHPVRRSAHQE